MNIMNILLNIITLCIIAFIPLLIIIGIIEDKKEKKIVSQKEYKVYLSLSSKIFYFPIPIGAICLFLYYFNKIKQNGFQNDILKLAIIFAILIITFLACLYFITYTIYVKGNNFTVKKLFHRKRTYKFSDLTSYRIQENTLDEDYIDSIIAFIGEKQVIYITEGYIGYEKISKTIKKHAKKIVNSKKSKTN